MSSENAVNADSTEKTTYIRITGSTVFGKSIEKFYRGSMKQAEREFLLTPPEQGGPTSWSTEEIEELPDYVYLECPDCGHRYLNKNLITEV